MCFKHEKALLSASVGPDSATLALQKTEAVFVALGVREAFPAVSTAGLALGP